MVKKILCAAAALALLAALLVRFCPKGRKAWET